MICSCPKAITLDSLNESQTRFAQQSPFCLQATGLALSEESIGRNVAQVLGKVKHTSVGKSYYVDVAEITCLMSASGLP